jgi:2-polyprenyl-3-methyl-5-hydroxy-6-metoxy-1,4-benzoquinol methylase
MSSPVRALPDGTASHAEAIARDFRVSPALHTNDNILWFLFGHPQFKEPRDAIQYYFDSGLTSAKRIFSIVTEHAVERPLFRRLLGRPMSILDFASGYGCVSRHFPAIMPQARLTACDIHPDAVNFIRKEMGIEAILSAHEPEKLLTPRGFDVVFALSFFSHMPDATWGRWLRSLCAQLVRGGILIFTTNGMKSFPCFGPEAKLDERGFYFLTQSEQTDLDPAQYGSTIVQYDYVYRQIGALGARLLAYEEGVWYGHQDAYILRRI